MNNDRPSSNPRATGRLIGRRLLAELIDAVTAFTPCWLVAPLLIGLSSSDSMDSAFVFRFVLMLNALLSAIFYIARPVILHASGRRTLGLRAMGLRLQTAGCDGSRAALWRVAVCQLLLAVWIGATVAVALYPLVILPVVAAIARRDGRPLPDAVCGIVTVDDRAPLPQATQDAAVEA